MKAHLIVLHGGRKDCEEEGEGDKGVSRWSLRVQFVLPVLRPLHRSYALLLPRQKSPALPPLTPCPETFASAAPSPRRMPLLPSPSENPSPVGS